MSIAPHCKFRVFRILKRVVVEIGTIVERYVRRPYAIWVDMCFLYAPDDGNGEKITWEMDLNSKNYHIIISLIT